VEQRTRQGLHAADTAALGQVLQRFEGEDDLGVGADFLQPFLDRVHGPAGPVTHRSGQHLVPLAAGEGQRVPEAHLGPVFDVLAAGARGLERPVDYV